MKIELSKVADISVGYSFKAKTLNIHDSGYRLVQIKDISSPIIDSVQYLTSAYHDLGAQLPNVEQNDIIIPIKGARHAASKVIKKNYKISISNTIAVIRPDEHVISDYLLWYLNRTVVSEDLNAMKTGSTVPRLSVKNIKSYEIDLPSLRVQRKIAHLYINSLSQEKTFNELIKTNNELIEAYSREVIACE